MIQRTNAQYEYFIGQLVRNSINESRMRKRGDGFEVPPRLQRLIASLWQKMERRDKRPVDRVVLPDLGIVLTRGDFLRDIPAAGQLSQVIAHPPNKEKRHAETLPRNHA